MNALFLLQVGVSPSSLAPSESPLLLFPREINSSGKSSNFEAIRSEFVSDFEAVRPQQKKTRANYEHTGTHTHVLRECAATKTVEPTRRVTAWLLPT